MNAYNYPSPLKQLKRKHKGSLKKSGLILVLFKIRNCLFKLMQRHTILNWLTSGFLKILQKEQKSTYFQEKLKNANTGILTLGSWDSRKSFILLSGGGTENLS